MRKFYLLILSLTLAACQHSPHRHYYLLSAPAFTESASNITQVTGVGPITVADYLERSQIVYADKKNHLQVSENDYWGEPLDKGITRVLVANLAQQDKNRSFIQFPWRSDSKPNHSLRVQIQNLNCVDGQASLDAMWELVDNNSKSVLQRRHFVRTIPANINATDLAQAYSNLIAALAGDMRATIADLP